MRWRKWKYPIPGAWPTLSLALFPVLRVVRLMTKNGPQMIGLEPKAEPADAPNRVIVPGDGRDWHVSRVVTP